MEKPLTDKTVSLSELSGDPEKVIRGAAGQPLAIMDGEKLKGYFVPASAVHKTNFKLADTDEIDTAIAKRKDKIQPILDYLRDK